jgi:hypothetical protein
MISLFRWERLFFEKEGRRRDPERRDTYTTGDPALQYGVRPGLGGRSAYTVRGYKGEGLPNEPNSVQAGVESLVWESQKRTQMGHTAGAFASQAGTARVSPLQPTVVQKPDPPSGNDGEAARPERRDT